MYTVVVVGTLLALLDAASLLSSLVNPLASPLLLHKVIRTGIARAPQTRRDLSLLVLTA